MHKRLVIAYFEELAYAARFAEPKRIAVEINLLHEGAMAVAQMTRIVEPARQAKLIAAQLLAVEKRVALARQPGERTQDSDRPIFNDLR